MAPTESLSVTVAPRGLAGSAGRDTDRAVVWLRGEHDASTGTALSETLERAIALDDGDLVMDLSEVQFMDAAIVGLIVRTRELLRLRSRSLTLRSPSRCARRILEACGLADLDPSAVDIRPTTGPAGALGTWVGVPATDRLDRRADTSTPMPSSVPDPVRAGSVAVAREASSVGAQHRVDERTTNLAGSEGP